MRQQIDFAPGAPGIPARWTSSAKSGVGTALSPLSPVWFTLSHGILNEIYYPRVDSACTRDFGLLVTGPSGYFSEEKRDCIAMTTRQADGVPAFHVVSTARDGRYGIEKDIVSDPARPCVLQRITFRPANGAVDDYGVFALLAPHLTNAGMQNSAWVADYDGAPLLMACGRSRYLALAASTPWKARSAGYVGASDGYRQLRQHGALDPCCQRADEGNVALTGEIGLTAENPTVVLALAFGQSETEAAATALASLHSGFDVAQDRYRENWHRWQQGLVGLDRPHAGKVNAYRVSTAVLAAHRAPPIARPTGRAPSSRASPSHGVTTRATTIWAAITWSGPAIWSRRRAASWPRATAGKRWPSWTICVKSSSVPAIGRKTSGSTDGPTGPACRWTNARFPSCWPICCIVITIWPAGISTASCR